MCLFLQFVPRTKKTTKYAKTNKTNKTKNTMISKLLESDGQTQRV